MTRVYRILFAAFFFVLSLFASGLAQVRLKHFTYVSNTGNNATVGIPAGVNPNVAGTALATGDEIGVFTPDGLCVGAVIWTAGAGAAITVWGDNDQTPAVDGIRAGEQILFCLWRQAANAAYSEATATYSLGDGRYAVNGINAVASLTATSNVTMPLAPKLALPANNATNAFVNPSFQWYTACSARTYELQVSTSSTFATLALSRSSIDSTYHDISRFATSSHLASNTTYFWRVRAVNPTGTGGWSTVWNFTTSTTVGVKEAPIATPQVYTLDQNYPNPFNPSTTIAFQVPMASHVTLKIYDLLGKEIVTLVNEQKSPGAHQVRFDAAGLSGSVYFYRMQAGQFTQTRKLLLLR